MSENFYVYILASRRNGTLYTGVTNDLIRRVWEHKKELAEGFTKKHGVKTLVYFEVLEDPLSAIQREKTIKRWQRSWKVSKIEERNPTWHDLYDDLL